MTTSIQVFHALFDQNKPFITQIPTSMPLLLPLETQKKQEFPVNSNTENQISFAHSKVANAYQFLSSQNTFKA